MSDRHSGRPNILLVMTDEHAAQFAGTYGHPFIATPGMDRLAREGVTFDAAYCNNPLCVPSRLSFMTGRYTHRCGGWDNSTALPVDAVTWPYLLRAQGYEVALSGKMHLIGPDPLHGFERQLAVDLHAGLVHPVYRWAEGVPEAAEPWPGVARTGSRVPEHGRRFGAEAGADAPMEQPVETGPGTTPEIEADDLAVERAIEFLRSREGADAPFALCVGLIAPHFPFVVPEPFFSQYFPEHADLPDLPPGHLQALSPASQRLRRAFGFHGHTDDQVRRARAAYYGLVSYADSKLDALLDVLDRTGLAENTIVVHTSDHGELLGEHGLWRKMSFYEQSARVPLQIRWPGRGVAGERIAACTSLVDVTATLVDAAGATAAGAGAGRPQPRRPDRRLGRGDPRMAGRGVRRAHLARHRPAAGHAAPRRLEALPVRRGRSRGGAVRPAEDPGEFHNRAGDPEVAEIEAELRDALLSRWEPAAVDAQVRAHQDRVALIRSASRPGERPLF